jgi:hypothetical protein
LKSDLDRYEKRPDNHPVYEFESMSICEFTIILFEVYYKKTPNIDDVDKEDDNEPKKIDQGKYLVNGAIYH